MRLSEDLAWRGLIKDKTFADISWIDSPKVFYHGYDPSAPSFTVGNLAALILDKRLMDAGWQAVIVMGGGTSLVGDPGGKDEERQLKSRDEIEANIKGVRAQTEKIFTGQQFEMVDNYEWLAGLKYLDFLRNVGKNYSMTEMLQREFVTERIGAEGAGISYAEFSYSLIQGYDYWHLYRKYKTQLQLGGSDQWGNMLSGVSLIRKKENQEVHAMSMPLVIDQTTGRKFGKSEAGAIWLDANRTSIFKFYQFWFNSSDHDVEGLLKVFTLMDKSQIEEVVTGQKNQPSSRVGQKRLAFEVTTMVHGNDQAKKQTRIAETLAGERSVGELDDSDISVIREEISHLKVHPGMSLIQALTDTKLAASSSDARRLLQGNAVYINGNQTNKAHLEATDLINGRLMLRRGKAHKDSALIELI